MLRWDARSGPARERDELAREEPLEIRVNGRAVSVTMRTPGDDVELAVGFALTEGLVSAPCDIEAIRSPALREPCNIVEVRLAAGVRVDFEQLTRHVFVSSSCGLCGKATIEAVHRRFPPLRSEIQVEARALLSLPERLRSAQASFARTGGLHAAGIFDLEGELLALFEDVGRHNAVDKALGHALLSSQLPLHRHVLMLSGRSSFEIMQKALAARIPVVAAVSAPSSLAVQFAERAGQTLIGFLRDGRMNVYSRAERVRFE